MTNDEIQFTGSICMAATMMGIRIRHEGDDKAGHTFMFVDPLTSAVMVGEAKPTKQEALYAAAKTLQSRLCVCN